MPDSIREALTERGGKAVRSHPSILTWRNGHIIRMSFVRVESINGAGCKKYSSMKKPSKTLIPNLIFLLILTACSSDAEAHTPLAITATPQPTATEVRVLPTPASTGDSIIWEDLQVTMDQIEITEEFINE